MRHAYEAFERKGFESYRKLFRLISDYPESTKKYSLDYLFGAKCED